VIVRLALFAAAAVVAIVLIGYVVGPYVVEALRAFDV
jgi:hypothetical protein